MGQCNSQETKEYYRRANEEYRKYHLDHSGHNAAILIVAIIMFISGTLAIAFWAAMLDITWDNRGGPITSGAGIWGGFYALVVSAMCFGLVATKNYGLLSAVMWTTIGGTGGVYSQIIRLSVEAWQDCRPTDVAADATMTPEEEYCLPDPKLVSQLGLGCIVASAVMTTSCIIVPILYGVATHRVNKEIKQCYQTSSTQNIAKDP